MQLVLTVLLVGMGWLTPSLSSRTVRFGVRVPDNRVEDPLVLKETARFRRALVIGGVIVALAGAALMLTVGVAATPAPVIVQIIIWYTLYFRANRAITAAKRDQDWFAGVHQAVTADTSLHSDPPKFPWPWLLLPVAIVVASAVIGAIRYPDLPDPLPMHFDADGVANRWVPKSVGSAFTVVYIQAGLTVLLSGLAVLISRGPADVDPARPAASVRAHREFVVRLGKGLVALTALADLGLFATDWSIWDGSRATDALLPLTLGPILVGVALLVLIVVQRNKDDGADEGTGLSHRDDDRNWVGGIIYRNADDPSWFVQRRFGVGWTVNFGNPAALITCGALTVGVVTVSLLLPFILR
ncbi:DUF1648 domain-containing protein [Kutzneria sp. NPDC052558]|uniref:DUF1648 domain-containing protein n=1 Tax=Kutzneria sp. NPDC052558 TaxID=3364121 RepID=UPI0037C91B38